MSQQGIFSIAPDSQGASQSPDNDAGSSPFSAFGSEPDQDQGSPFSAVGESSPFRQAMLSQASGQGKAGIPERRPEGQPPALGGNITEAEPTVETVKPVSDDPSPFASARDDSPPQEESQPQGSAFQMNGFPEQGSSQVMEAAPAPVAPAHEPSSFVLTQEDFPDYEAAKANLEPQQDFAAPPRRSQPAQSPATAGGSTPGPAFQQIELRAIFGVDHVLDTREILQRARDLPGIQDIAVVGRWEAAALSNFRQAMQSMGFGGSTEIKLGSNGDSVDFLTEGETTIAVLQDGPYAPGVQETLIIVAREIGKLA